MEFHIVKICQNYLYIFEKTINSNKIYNKFFINNRIRTNEKKFIIFNYLKKRKFLLLLFSEYFFKIPNNLIDKNLLNKSLIRFINPKNKKFCDIKRN